MRLSNWSAPFPPGGSPWVREKMCVINKGGTLEKRVIRVLIRASQGKYGVIRRPGQPKKKWFLQGYPGGMGAEQFDRRITPVNDP